MDEKDSIVNEVKAESDVQKDVTAEQPLGEESSQDENQEGTVQAGTPVGQESSQALASEDVEYDGDDDEEYMFSDDEDNENMLEAYDETLRDFEEGEIVKGVVIKIDRDEVMVDVGYKSEGYIPLSEFGTNPDGTPIVFVTQLPGLKPK